MALDENENKGVTIILFSGDLDKALAAFIMATTAASMGSKVVIFFTFWGLNILKKDNGKLSSKKLVHKMFNLFNRGGMSRLKLSKLNMGGLGTSMMKTLMHQKRMPSIEQLVSMAGELDIEFVVCTTSMEIMGLSKEDFIPQVETFAGAATYFEQALEGKVNLFI